MQGVAVSLPVCFGTIFLSIRLHFPVCGGHSCGQQFVKNLKHVTLFPQRVFVPQTERIYRFCWCFVQANKLTLAVAGTPVTMHMCGLY